MWQQFRTHGLPCPECGTRIAVELGQLLAIGKVVCPQCSLELVVDQEKSSVSMELLGEIKNQLDQHHTYFEQAQLGLQGGPQKRTRRTRQRRKNTD